VSTETYRINTPLGIMSACAGGGRLLSLTFTADQTAAEAESGQHDPVLRRVRLWLEAYFAGRCPVIQLPLDPAGSPFQKTVWQLLLDIPYGQKQSYGDIARRVASLRAVPHMSAQAVGQAVGKNPIAIIIPCHRVLGADGSLTGYAAGLERKKYLLRLEGCCFIE
jgi:methylated-DNA-[protein]-cysteine S-methyltransferase